MPNNIKPSEVSDVLLRQLENIDTNIKFEEVGIVLSIGDGVARIYGLTGVTENELIEFDNGVMAVAMNLEERQCGRSAPRIVRRHQGRTEREAHGPRCLNRGERKHARSRHQSFGTAARRRRRSLTARNSSCRSTVRLLVLFIASQSTRHFKQD